MTTDLVVRWDPNQEEMIDDGDNSSSRLFERSRIKALADERETVQKKTFQKWVNSHLVRVNSRIGDLYVDLRDGKMLIKLLEVLSGERLPKPTKGKMRIHCLENVDKALQFLREQRVHLENMGSHDVVDGNARLTLGLIWTIILRFQIQDITIQEADNREARSAKDALLLWCQMKTAGYPNVNVRNFTTSWRDGLAFNAIIHKHRPDLIKYEQLQKSNAVYNLNNSFTTAESLGIAPLLDAEDVNVEYPDEKSIITYVVTYYHYFTKMKQESVQGRRIGKVIDNAIETETMINQYETLTSDLLDWINKTIEQLGDRKFENNLAGVQEQLSEFNTYRTKDKPPKFVEKGNLEILLFTIQSKMRANNQKPYLPKEGRLISDINKAWEQLEKSEHERELALREEIIRQEKLEQLAARFDRKAGMRETWLSENQRLVSQDNFGFDLPALEAAAKKHEAIETDIYAYEERVQAVLAVADELEKENYHDIERINLRKENVLRLWKFLLELLQARRKRLELSMQLQKIFQEMLYTLDWMEELKARLLSEDYGRHLMDVEDLMTKHSMIEADIAVVGDRVKNANAQAERFTVAEVSEEVPGYHPTDPTRVREHMDHLQAAYEELLQMAADRKNRLGDSRKLWQFYSEMTEEEAWIKEQEQIMSSPDTGHDVTSVHLMLNKHKSMEAEMSDRHTHLQGTVKVGEDMIEEGHFGSEGIRQRIDEINGLWDNLIELAAHRKTRILEAVDYYQFFADCDDVDTWMLDTLRLVSSEDVGRDEASVQGLIKKHADVTEELKNYSTVIEALHEQADNLGEQDRQAPEVQARLASIDRRYRELDELAKLRKQRLLDALSLYKLYNEADGVEQWLQEKEKMLHTMEPSRDIEDLEVMKHRFEGFEKEMNDNAPRVAVVNQLARQLLQVDHPNSEDIVARQNQLNERWSTLNELSDRTKDKLMSAHGIQTFHIEAQETITWIEDKTRLLASTEDLGNDLAGVMTLQRRLSFMERDLAAIQAKLDALEKEADKIGETNPEEAEAIRDKVAQIHVVWEDLTKLLNEREAKLGESGNIQRFLRDLDHFQTWLSTTTTTVASEDQPTSLAEAEQFLKDHQNIKEEIDNYEDDYTKMREMGHQVCEGQTDPQYLFLKERLNALDAGWTELHQMWEQRQNILTQAMDEQVFLREGKQAEQLLNQQENFLAKDEKPANLEQAQEMIKKHEAFMTTMDANDDKINNVAQLAQKLCEEGHYNADKINKKAENIQQRRQANHDAANQRLEKLKDALQLQQFVRNTEELKDWLDEKVIQAQDDTYRSAKTIHSKWTRHQAFQAEIQANKERLHEIQKEAEELAKEKPELSNELQARLDDLNTEWDQLEHNTQEKGQKLFDANRAQLYEQSCEDIDGWLNELESQIVQPDLGQDLTSVTVLLQTQANLESELSVKQQQVMELESQAAHLDQLNPEDVEQIHAIHAKKAQVEERFQKLQAPLTERKAKLSKQKEVFQFGRDVEDEKMWIDEKMPLASSVNYGNSLQSVQMLQKKHESLQREIDNHELRINQVCDLGRQLIDEGHEQSELYERLIKELKRKWQDLKDAMNVRKAGLEESDKAQQYYFDTSEAEAWMSEMELYMMTDDRGKDELSAAALQKKHQLMETEVDNYADTIRQLGETARNLIDENHPESDQIAIRQSQVDKLYAGLKDLVGERHGKLDEGLKLFILNRDIDDLMQWIAEREVVASSSELGQDFDHVTPLKPKSSRGSMESPYRSMISTVPSLFPTADDLDAGKITLLRDRYHIRPFVDIEMLQERFKEFARDTQAIGRERVDKANEHADRLILSEHADAALIAEWKDALNEAWTDLLELIDTRQQMLQASWELHKFFHDCKDVLNMILEKVNSMSDELGRDAQSVSVLQRKHASFEQDLVTLAGQVQGVQGKSMDLQASYAGDKAREIQNREAEVVHAWRNLQNMVDGRRLKLVDTGDLFKFFSMVRDLMLWMDDIFRQMANNEKPRDVSGVELLMNQHQSIKAEIDARDDNFKVCINLGQNLLSRKHYASEEIKERLMALTNQRQNMTEKWEHRWEHLQLILEVYQFARDAAVAEAWLFTQENYINNPEVGSTLDEVENLLKKHESFEKSVIAQEDRFSALTRLTTFELKELRKKQEEIEMKRRAEEEARTPKKDSPDAAAAPAIINGEKESPTTPPGIKEGGGIGDEEEFIEGFLIRKHEWETTTKKAGNRSWDKMYCVLRGAMLSFYKDAKHAKTEPSTTFHHETPLDLSEATVQEATDYTKKKNVLRLKLPGGGEYLFQAKDREELGFWVRRVAAVTSSGGEASGEPRSQTLPAAATSSTKKPEEETKKRSFFTLKKK